MTAYTAAVVMIESHRTGRSLEPASLPNARLWSYDRILWRRTEIWLPLLSGLLLNCNGLFMLRPVQLPSYIGEKDNDRDQRHSGLWTPEIILRRRPWECITPTSYIPSFPARFQVHDHPSPHDAFAAKTLRDLVTLTVDLLTLKTQCLSPNMWSTPLPNLRNTPYRVSTT